jgi:PAS domain S-box-containing protein
VIENNIKNSLNIDAMQKQALNIFTDNIAQFIFWKDRDSVYLGCNNNFANSAGLTNKEEIIGKTDYDLPWSKEESDFFRKIDKEVIDAGKPQLDFEEQQTLANGETRWLQTSKVPMLDKDGNVIGLIGWYLDITEHKKMQIKIDENNKALLDYNERLKTANKELEIVNLDLEKFTYAASHDLKTPIRIMMSFVQLLKRFEKDNLKKESLELIDYIINAANRMHLLVGDILTYAKTGVKETKASPVNIMEIVSHKLIDLKQLIDLKSVKIDLNLPSTAINCYSHLIGLVFYNLINNAIKFNKSDVPKICCNYTESLDYWTFTVSDNGIGIEPEYVDTIFEPFKRLVGSDYEGSGLGLSICKRVANIHKGKIWIENNPKGGTIFYFSILKHI